MGKYKINVMRTQRKILLNSIGNHASQQGYDPNNKPDWDRKIFRLNKLYQTRTRRALRRGQSLQRHSIYIKIESPKITLNKWYKKIILK